MEETELETSHKAALECEKFQVEIQALRDARNLDSLRKAKELEKLTWTLLRRVGGN